MGQAANLWGLNVILIQEGWKCRYYNYDDYSSKNESKVLIKILGSALSYFTWFNVIRFSVLVIFYKHLLSSGTVWVRNFKLLCIIVFTEKTVLSNQQKYFVSI